MHLRRATRRFIRSLVLGLACPLAASLAHAQSLDGSWDLTLHTPQGDRPAWIRIAQLHGSPTLEIVGPVGSMLPLRQVTVHATDLHFVVTPQDDIGLPGQTTFTARLQNGTLTGTAKTTSPTAHQAATWTWTGNRAPTLQRPEPAHWSAPVPLFDGHDLAGWRLRDAAHAGTWTADNGILISAGRGSDLISTQSFQDFQLHLEFNAGPDSNAGVYLRGRSEIQIETDSAAEPPSHHTAGLYGFLAPTPEQPRRPNTWQTLDITVVGRLLTVRQNGILVIDHRTIPGITGGALDSHEAQPGPIMLQGSEPGRVLFRNITIRTAPH